MTMKVAKRDFYASASSHLARLFRVIQSLTTFPQGSQKDKKPDISCEDFASIFAVLSLHQDLPTMAETVQELAHLGPLHSALLGGA